MTKADARSREAMYIEDGIFLHSRGGTYSGTTAAGRSLLFLSGAAWLAVSPTCFERAECGFLHSAKTNPAKSMWLITRVVYTVLVLLLQCLIVRRMLQTVSLSLWCVWSTKYTKQTKQAAATNRFILLEFPCQPINHNTCYFHHCFPGVLQRVIARHEIDRLHVVPALSW